MTGSIRVQVTAAATDTGWLFTLGCPDNGWVSKREVPAFSGDDGPRYPVPRCPCTTECDHRQLCPAVGARGITDLLGRLDSREADAGTAGDVIGRYLFDTLLSADWTVIVEKAVSRKCEVIEVALTWPYQDADWPLSQLPWELMRNGTNRRLCPSEHKLSVAVTRVVEGTTAEMPSKLFVPPRVLFVLGAPAADPTIRAGAEMLAVLSEFRRAGVRIQHRILDNATPRTLREAMRTFTPQIVHFISHGDVDVYGRGRLMLPTGNGTTDPWQAPQLLENLQVDGSLPPVVVLSACDTAGEVIQGPRHSAPLAAELIRGGIPVIVAMAGKISDRAARIFTRYFGRELADGKSLVAATADARRIAFAESAPDSSDWALPAIFFSARVDPDQVARDKDPAAEHVDQLLTMARLNKHPVFCAREKFLRTFWAMLGDGTGRTGWEPQPGNRPAVLVACADHHQHGVGKTRLLVQLAREALQNGHFPLMIGMGSSPPKNVAELAYAMGEALRDLGHRVLRVASKDDNFGSELRALFRADQNGGQNLPGQEVADIADVLERDADQLRAKAIAAYSSLFSETSRFVVLIDDLGPECVLLLDALFEDFKGLQDFGFGVSKQNPVPVVLVVVADNKKYDIRSELSNGGIREEWLVNEKLLPFDKEGEDMLAYERILLNPAPSGSDRMKKSWVFNRDVPPEDWARNVWFTRYKLKGIPGIFDNMLIFEDYLTLADKFRVLKDADDIPPELVP